MRYNVMVTVARETTDRPLDVYRFFQDEGVEYIQFTPVVERLLDRADRCAGISLAGPAAIQNEEQNRKVISRSVDPAKYGDFLNTIFDKWVRHDVGQNFVMNFE